MANLVTNTNYGRNQKQILIANDSFFVSLPAIIKGTAGSTIYAGQPLSGDIKDRDAGFTAVDSGDAAGLLLHDVVIDADGQANGTILLAGCVDLLKLEDSVATAAQAATLSNIILVKGSAI